MLFCSSYAFIDWPVILIPIFVASVFVSAVSEAIAILLVPDRKAEDVVSRFFAAVFLLLVIGLLGSLIWANISA